MKNTTTVPTEVRAYLLKGGFIVDHTRGVYIGLHADNQTASGYISALEDVATKYGKKTMSSRWVCTSSFGYGEGYRESYEIIGFDLYNDALTYVNRAFNFDGLSELQSHAQYFNNIPSGGYMEVSSYIQRLKTLI